MRTFHTIKAAAVIAAMFMGCTLAHAHNFWVRPGSFAVSQGDLGKFFLMHGPRFNGEFVPRNEPYVERFELIDAQGTQRILGRHGQPTNIARFQTPGTNIVVYQSREVLSELPGERFESYLKDQGLDKISRQRAELGETEADGVEVYIRCAKALVSVTGRGETAPGGLTDRVAGLPLEIVLEPMDTAEVGQTARVRVLLDGKPLADARLVAVSQKQTQADPAAGAIVRTDADGYASIEINDAGPWMITCLHMFRIDERDDADWKSYWGSLTFSVSDTAAEPRHG